MRRRESNSRDLAADQGLQALEGQRQVRAALVRHDRVNLVDDHRANVGEHAATALAGEKDVERLGSGHEDLRRLLHHFRAPVRRRVSGPDSGPDVDVLVAELFQRRANPLQWHLEVLVDVVAERLERRDVENAHAVFEALTQTSLNELVDRAEERCQRLARARGRGDERMPPLTNRRPALDLRRRRLAKGPLEPSGHSRVEAREGH